MTKPKPEIRLNVWLETADGLLFGIGRAELLDKIEELRLAQEGSGGDVHVVSGGVGQDKEDRGDTGF